MVIRKPDEYIPLFMKEAPSRRMMRVGVFILE